MKLYKKVRKIWTVCNKKNRIEKKSPSNLNGLFKKICNP